jgi:hypothetical protein
MQILIGLLILGQVKFEFQIKDLKDPKSKTIQANLKKVAGVFDCAISGTKVTITAKKGDWVQLNLLNAEVKKEELEIDYASITLGGRVALGFNIPENTSKIMPTIKAFPGVTKVEKIDDNFNFDVTCKGVKLMDLYTKVSKECKWPEDRVKEIINDVAWYGGDAVKDQKVPVPGG